MLVNILDLEKIVVNDIMIPRNEIYGLDINQDAGTLLEKIAPVNTHACLFLGTN